MVPGAELDYVDAHPATAPLIVEVADSSLRLDRRFKAGLYARAGLPEYWIVNLLDGTLEVHREPVPVPDSAFGARDVSVETLRPPAVVSPLAVSHVAIAVAELVRAAR